MTWRPMMRIWDGFEPHPMFATVIRLMDNPRTKAHAKFDNGDTLYLDEYGLSGWRETNATSPPDLVGLVLSNVSDDLRKAPWRGSTNLLAGHCYVVSEALYHLLGGTESRWKPMFIRHEGASHWFLQHENGRVLDPTAGQFETAVSYPLARGRGFLTAKPSSRARELLKRCHRSSDIERSLTSLPT